MWKFSIILTDSFEYPDPCHEPELDPGGQNETDPKHCLKVCNLFPIVVCMASSIEEAVHFRKTPLKNPPPLNCGGYFFLKNSYYFFRDPLTLNINKRNPEEDIIKDVL